MNDDVRDWLKDADPVANESPLSDADVQRMRRAIVAAGESSHSFADWARGSWAAATVVVAVTIAVSMSRWTKSGETPRVSGDITTTAAPPDRPTRRQVQLIAPRGTRVIWIFNDEFNP